MKINIQNISTNEVNIGRIPKYAHRGDAGIDLWSDTYKIIRSGEHAWIKTGLKIDIPEGYEGQIRPRSGLAMKYGLIIPNSPGTIDSNYTGEIQVVLHLLPGFDNDFEINIGDRIAQLVISKQKPYPVEFNLVDDIEKDTERGDGGFGSSGK